MRYIPPLNATADDAVYITGNPSINLRGSQVPAQATEYPQREIINVIMAANLIPDRYNLTQLNAAIDEKILHTEQQINENLNHFSSQLSNKDARLKKNVDALIDQSQQQLQQQIDDFKQWFINKIQQFKNDTTIKTQWNKIAQKPEIVQNIRLGGIINYSWATGYQSIHEPQGLVITDFFNHPDRKYPYNHQGRILQKLVNDVWYTVNKI